MPIKLKAGCYYRTKAGRIVGPAEHRDSTIYPWQVGDEIYTRKGRFWSNVDPSPEDLIAEAPAPTKPKARKRKGRKMVVRYVYLLEIEMGDDSPELASFMTIGMARSSRNNRLDAGYRVGPITRITLPAPAGRVKK